LGRKPGFNPDKSIDVKFAERSKIVEKIRMEVAEAQKIGAESQKRGYDKNRYRVKYEVGELVYIWRPVKSKVDASKKFLSHWLGPMRVTRQLGQNTYELRCCSGKMFQENVQNMRIAWARPENMGGRNRQEKEPIKPNKLTEDEKEGTYVIWREPDIKDPKNQHVGIIVERLYETDEVEIQYLNSYYGTKDLSKRRFKKVWIDSTDGKEVYTNNPKPSYDRLGARVDANQINYSCFPLNKDGSLPSEIIEKLNADGANLNWELGDSWTEV
jgi:hypothetical protein